MAGRHWVEDIMNNQTDRKLIEDMKKKPSRFQILLHLWGGICLNAFAETSGLSRVVLAPLKGFEATSASRYAGVAGLLTVAFIVAGYFLSSCLVKVIDSSSLSQKSRTIIKASLPISYIIIAVLLAMVTTSILTSFGENGR